MSVGQVAEQFTTALFAICWSSLSGWLDVSWLLCERRLSLLSRSLSGCFCPKSRIAFYGSGCQTGPVQAGLSGKLLETVFLGHAEKLQPYYRQCCASTATRPQGSPDPAGFGVLWLGLGCPERLFSGRLEARRATAPDKESASPWGSQADCRRQLPVSIRIQGVPLEGHKGINHHKVPRATGNGSTGGVEGKGEWVPTQEKTVFRC